MGVVDRREELFDAVVRLRRAERNRPHDPDLAAVRLMLETQLGETVSQRMAARLLGVDHKALARWIRAGDVPTVITPEGRTAVPVAALLRLHDDVNESRAHGSRRRHHLEPSMQIGRRRAEALQPDSLVDAGDALDGGHTRAERRSLAYHRALAKQLRRRDIDDALHVLWSWRDLERIDPRYAEEWEEILARPMPEIRRTITEDSQRGRDLRQNSPFAGMLSEPERRRIVEEIR
jgi:hypothetical protein